MNEAIRGWTEVETWDPSSPGNEEMRALAAAEIEREYILAVRAYLQADGLGEPPDHSLYGLSLDEAQPLILAVLTAETAAEVAVRAA